MNLTERWLRAVKVHPPRRREEYHDDQAKGLSIRVSVTGRRVWRVRIGSGEGRRRTTLGEYPDVSLREARDIAERMQGEHVRALRGLPSPERSIAAINQLTFGELAEDFYKGWSLERKAPKGQELDRSILDLHLLPHWGSYQARKIDASMVRARLGEIAQKAPVQANRTRSLLSRLLGYGVEQGLIENNPVSSVRAPTREKPRDRLLTDDEWRTIYRAFEQRRSSNGDYLCLIMLTGQRPGQLLDAKFSDVSDDWLHIPAERTKIGRRHAVYLASHAKAIIERRRALGIGKRWMFPGQNPRLHLATYANLIKKIRGSLGLPDWRPHDFRRYAFTTMRQLGISADDAEAVAHHTGSRVRRTYDVGVPFPQIERALTRFDEHVQRLLSED